MQPARLRPLHLFPDFVNAAGIHEIVDERMFVQQVAQFILVKGVANGGGKTRSYFRLLSITDGFDQEFPQGPSFKMQFTQHVEHLSSQGRARLLQFIQQGEIDVPFPGPVGNEVPEVAYLRLADSMNAAKPLLNPVRVPRQVVIHHQVRPLQVDAFARRVGSQQYLDFRVVPEGLLRLQPVFPAHAAVDQDNRLGAPLKGCDTLLQVG